MSSAGADPSVVVLGVGNLLMGDDGFGIHVVRALAARTDLPAGVALVDGGTLGLRLMDVIASARKLVVVDASRRGGRPGSLSRLAGREVLALAAAGASAHDQGLAELLVTAARTGVLPTTAVIPAEIEDASLGLELSPPLREKVKEAAEAVLAELSRAVG